MAEGYLRYFAGNKAQVYSAGVETHGVNPRAVAVMKEDGVDISTHTSNNINEYRNIDFDYVITVCDNAKERCPFFPLLKSFTTTFLTLQKQPEQRKKSKRHFEVSVTK